VTTLAGSPPGAIPLEIEVGVAKVPKYATSISGDTLEMIERPHGGISLVLADGQRSGRTARIISNIVARKAVSLLGEGVRDGATARAAHDYLRTHRGGQVSAELQIVSVDLATRTLVISRNARCPLFVWLDGSLRVLQDDSEPIGIHEFTRPSVVELAIAPYTVLIQCTDGLPGAFAGKPPEGSLESIIMSLLEDRPHAKALADALLEAAIQAETGRPSDDISVAVLAVLPNDSGDGARRLSARFPVPPVGAA